MQFLVQTCFRRNDFSTIKNFRRNVFCWKYLELTCFRGNDFATIKNFRPKMFWGKYLMQTCFRGNYFVTIESSKKKLMNIFVQTRFRVNDFAAIKNFRPQFFLMKIFGANLFSTKWFCNNKKIWTNFFMQILVQTCFPRNDFGTMKQFSTKKMFDKNIWCRPVFEEMILQP